MRWYIFRDWLTNRTQTDGWTLFEQHHSIGNSSVSRTILGGTYRNRVYLACKSPSVDSGHFSDNASRARTPSNDRTMSANTSFPDMISGVLRLGRFCKGRPRHREHPLWPIRRNDEDYELSCNRSRFVSCKFVKEKK